MGQYRLFGDYYSQYSKRNLYKSLGNKSDNHKKIKVEKQDSELPYLTIFTIILPYLKKFELIVKDSITVIHLNLYISNISTLIIL